MKELTPILFFQEILSSKRPHLNEAQKAIQAYMRINFNGGPYRKLLMINTLSQFIITALQRYVSSLDKLKFEVFYSSFKSKQQQTTKKRIKIKRQNTRKKTNKNKPDLTMNEILEIVVCDQLEEQSNNLPLQKVRNQEDTKQSLVIDIPPFEEDVILQLTQKVYSEVDSLIKQVDIPKWQPSKLENYKNWLALTQNGIDIPKIKRLQKTKKKSILSTEGVLDKKIDISQGIDQKKMIDQLDTKLKSSKCTIKKNGIEIDQKIEQIAPIIVDADRLVNEITNKLKKFSRNHQKIAKEVVNFRQPSQSFTPLIEAQQFCLKNSTSGIEQKFGNKQLENYLLTELNFAKKIAFRDVAKSQQFSNFTIGEIFYDILLCNYQLRQAQPFEFGEILILAI